MEKINVHMTLEDYKALRADLMHLYINEDNDETAEMLFRIYQGLNSWDFVRETEEAAR